MEVFPPDLVWVGIGVACVSPTEQPLLSTAIATLDATPASASVATAAAQGYPCH